MFTRSADDCFFRRKLSWRSVVLAAGIWWLCDLALTVSGEGAIRRTRTGEEVPAIARGDDAEAWRIISNDRMFWKARK